MNICLITDLYPVKFDEKYTPRTLSNFVEEWKQAGHNVSIIKPNFILNSFIRKKPYYRNGKYGDVLNLNFWLPFLRVPQLNIEKQTLIIAHMPSGILFADKLKLPFVAGIHQSDIDVLTKPIYKFYFGKRLYKALVNAKAIACRSYTLKKDLLKLFPEFKEKTFVAPSGIDENLIIKKELHFSKPIKVLTAANFKKRKNIDKVIRAIGGNCDFELTIIGSGEQEKFLQKLAKNFDNIKFLGYKKHQDVISEMQKHDIFILPSVNETFGLVYLEAMASGCITIGTKDTGIDGIIVNGENGFLIEPDIKNIKDVLNRIKCMDKNSLQTLSERSFHTIKQYTKKGCADKYLQQILSFCKDFDK